MAFGDRREGDFKGGKWKSTVMARFVESCSGNGAQNVTSGAPFEDPRVYAGNGAQAVSSCVIKMSSHILFS